MAHLMQQDSESSGYSTSASSDFGSLDERFKFPPAVFKSATKRRAVDKMEDLDEMMKESLVLSPDKRLRLASVSDPDIPYRGRLEGDERAIDSLKSGRPQTRRSTSQDMERSPRVRALRAENSGSSRNPMRVASALYTDSISPKLIGQYHGAGISPKKRCTMAGGGKSVYTKHRLGATFSPLVAGARRKPATPQANRAGMGGGSRQSPMNSPRHGGLRSRGTPRAKLMLNDRFKMLDD